MIDYGEEPSNQSQLELESEKGYILMCKARQWIADNPDGWKNYIRIAMSESHYGLLSPNYPIQILRHRHRISVRTDFAPYLARIAMELYPEVRFRLAKSRADGFCEVKL